MDENEAASGPDRIANPYFFEVTITNIYSNNIVLTRGLQVLSEFPIFAADKTLVADRYGSFTGTFRGPHIGACRMLLGASGEPTAGGLPVVDKRAVKRRGSGIEN